MNKLWINFRKDITMIGGYGYKIRSTKSDIQNKVLISQVE